MYTLLDAEVCDKILSNQLWKMAYYKMVMGKGRPWFDKSYFY